MTLRSPNIKIENQGVRYVQGVVQDHHCIFQPFTRDNDQGNDCYIEFVQNGLATNYGVFVQIKSGSSYKLSNGYKIPADKAHLDYWNRALTLTIGIVYDPEIHKAFWVDLTAYLKNKPQILNQKSHEIRVESVSEFSEESFPAFIQYCFEYKEQYTSYENFGRSLEWFSYVDNPELCYEGLKSLYSYHRNKPSTWYYIISTFGKINVEGIRRNILGLLSNCTDNPHVLWHANNIQYLPTKKLQDSISEIMTKHFRRTEVELTLMYMREGINRGSFSFLVFLVIDLVKDISVILKEISFQENMDFEERNFCFWLYMHFAKYDSMEETMKVANQYLDRFPNGYNDEALLGVKESIEDGILLPVG